MKPLPLALLLSIALPALASDLPPEVATAREAVAAFKEESTVRILNVWATWCVPCIAEMKDLEELSRALSGDGLEIIGLSMDDAIPGDRDSNKRKVSRFLDSKSITFANYYYTGKESDLTEELNFDGEIPLSILFDRNGEEVLRIRGAIVRAKLEATIRRLLSKQP